MKVNINKRNDVNRSQEEKKKEGRKKEKNSKKNNETKGKGKKEKETKRKEKKKKRGVKKGSANVRQMVHRRCCLREEAGEGERSACVMEGKEGRWSPVVTQP